HDRGIISEVLHSAKTGAGTIVQPIFPSAILIDKSTGQRWFGIEADRRFGQVGPGKGHVFVTSLKTRLRDYAEGRRTSGAGDEVGSDPTSFDIADLFRSFLQALAESIRRSQSLGPDESLEVVVTWPANANGAQRYITRKCFREAGFRVIDTLNEPTASAIELADCLTAGRAGRQSPGPNALAVFDLGGGTFDASVVKVDGEDFHVLASAGIERLGGDDFDNVLLDMFLKAMRVSPESLGGMTRHALLRHARAQKETISAGVMKSLFLNPRDFGLQGALVTIPVEAFFERVRPLIRPAIKLLKEIIEQAGRKEPRLQSGSPLTVYLVGGSSKLPLVAEMVSHAFPAERVILTDKPFMSVAMGAAICATQHVSYRDVFARHFGLIRLKDHGRVETFDTIFPAGTPVPRRGEPPLERTTWYHPKHNIGHLRYLECTSVGPDGLPAAGVRAWSDIRFPYDPAIPLAAPVSSEPIVSTDQYAGDPVCEVYRCDCDGVITVELRRPACKDARTYEVGRD
ncbi:MAG TPA: Hsp70 family protein, partial [Phycisphaerae bacterium]|nr:Hsp70 family protein [Phycisphaerae bacterium]